MTTRVRNLALGVGLAVVLTAIAIVPALGGVSTWKWALGVIGVVIFVLAERQGQR